jgi:hypothetical protein
MEKKNEYYFYVLKYKKWLFIFCLDTFRMQVRTQKIKIIPMKLLRTILFWYSMRSAAHRTSISSFIISWDHEVLF